MNQEISINLKPEDNLFQVESREKDLNGDMQVIKSKQISKEDLGSLMSKMMEPEELNKIRQIIKLARGTNITIQRS